MRVIVMEEKWDKSKLVQKLVKVRMKKSGTEYYRNQWVRKDYDSIGKMDRDTIKVMERDLQRRLKENGKVGREEYYKGVIEPIGREIAKEFKRRIENSGQDELEKKSGELREEIWRLQGDLSQTVDEGSAIEIREKIEEMRERVNQIREEYEEKKSEVRRMMLGELSKLREFGSTQEITTRHLGTSKSQIRDSIEEAMQYYPTEWLKESAKRGKIMIKKAKPNERGYYRDQARIGEPDKIVISGETFESQFETALHELGHRMEASGDRELYEYEDIFYWKRTSGDVLESLKKLTGLNYDAKEMTRKDKFLNPYMGKEYPYGTKHFELFTVGVQMGITEPEKLLKDLDMSAFIYGCLAVLKLKRNGLDKV